MDELGVCVWRLGLDLLEANSDLSFWENCIPEKMKYEYIEFSEINNIIADCVCIENIVGKILFSCKEIVKFIGFFHPEKDNVAKRGNHGALPCSGDDYTIISPLWFQRMIESFGFEIDVINKSGDKTEFFVKRMPMLKFEDGKNFSDYSENTIINVPFSHQHFERHYNLHKRRLIVGRTPEGWWDRTMYLVFNFKPWLFQPIQWCLDCGIQSQGSHRIEAARILCLESIDVRIMRHWWPGNCQREDWREA